MSMGRPGDCIVCERVTPDDRIELDVLLADPRRWPREVLGRWQLPPGILPARYKAWGAMAVGMSFLQSHGYEIKKHSLFRHWRNDVPLIAENVEDLIAQGSPGQDPRDVPATISGAIDPRRYLTYYARGIEVGIKGLDLLLARIAKLEEEDKPVPETLMRLAIDAGQRLSISQATLQKAGSMFNDDEREDDGFLGAGRKDVSPRFGHQRIRVIDGEARPIRDEGPADRADYDRRARAEGSVGLPHP